MLIGTYHGLELTRSIPLDAFLVSPQASAWTATMRGNLFAHSVNRTIPWALTKGCLLKPLSHLHCSLSTQLRSPSLLKNLPLNSLANRESERRGGSTQNGRAALNGLNAESSGPCVVCRNFKHTTLIIYSNATRFVCLRMLIKSVYEWGLKALDVLNRVWLR